MRLIRNWDLESSLLRYGWNNGSILGILSGLIILWGNFEDRYFGFEVGVRLEHCSYFGFEDEGRFEHCLYFGFEGDGGFEG